MYHLMKWFLFLFDPEKAHERAFSLWEKFSPFYSYETIKKPVELMGLTFTNPVGLAAGFDKNAEHIESLEKMGFGFLEIGTVTPKPQAGNEKPRIARLKRHKAIINRMGFPSKGVDFVVEQLKKHKSKVIIGANIGKNKDTSQEDAIHDYLHCYVKLAPYVDYITVNISSPNTPGLRDLQHGTFLFELLSKLKEAQQALKITQNKYVPLLLKIAPDLDAKQIKQIAQTCLNTKMDAVIATNTTIARPEAISSKQEGGLSGKPLYSYSLSCVKLLKKDLGECIPIIGCGGIMSSKNANEMFESGAKMVQLYTGLIYKGPSLVSKIVRNSKLS